VSFSSPIVACPETIKTYSKLSMIQTIRLRVA
jgi:hypothetical protein